MNSLSNSKKEAKKKDQTLEADDNVNSSNKENPTNIGPGITERYKKA